MERRRRFSIMKKVSLLILVIVVVAITSYTAFAIWQFKNDKLKYIYSVNATFTSTISQKIDANFANTMSGINSILSILRLAQIDKEKLPMLKVLFQNNSSLTSFAIYRRDPSGTPVADLGKEFSQSYAVFNKEKMGGLNENLIRSIDLNSIDAYMKSPKKSDEAFALKNVERGLFSYVYSLDQENLFFAVFNVDMDTLFDAIQESEVQESLILDGNARVIAHTDKGQVGSNASEHPMFQFANDNPFKDGGKEYVAGESQTAYVGNYSKMGHGLILITQTDKEKSFRGMNLIIYNSIFFAVLVMGFVILLGIYFSKTLTAPLQRLMSATEDLAAGNYQLEMNIKTNDEVGELADYFVRLGEKLSERETALEKMTELAIKDGMTGVYNNRHFRNRFAEFLSLARRHNHELSLLVLDVDHFKKFNDTYGHQQGDQVIKDLAKILVQSTRETDFVARYGGEEFVVILPDTHVEGAVLAAERIRQNYQRHDIVNLSDGSIIKSTCSVGVSSLKGFDLKTTEEFVELADQNLYAAKKGGRNRVCFNPEKGVVATAEPIPIEERQAQYLAKYGNSHDKPAPSAASVPAPAKEAPPAPEAASAQEAPAVPDTVSPPKAAGS